MLGLAASVSSYRDVLREDDLDAPIQLLVTGKKNREHWIVPLGDQQAQP